MILISPWAKPLRNGADNPKNYPFWPQLIALIDQPVTQVGTSGEVSLVEDVRRDLDLHSLASLIKDCTTWIGVDSFFQHYCWHLGKPGLVLWGQSDPVIFGHPENINLLKDRSYLRPHQFWLWEQAEYREDCWVSPQEAAAALKSLV